MPDSTVEQWAARKYGHLTDAKRASVLLLREERGWGAAKIAKALDLDREAVGSYFTHLAELHYPEVKPISTFVWDLETTNLKADMGTLLMGSFLDLATGEVVTARLSSDANVPIEAAERDLVEEVSALFSSASILIGHNSKAFDRNFMNGCVARHGLPALPRRFHIDTYMVARYGLKGIYQSNSLDNLADILKVGVKDRPSKHDWREANIRDEDALERIRLRCESDVRLTAAIWSKLEPYWLMWKGDR